MSRKTAILFALLDQATTSIANLALFSYVAARSPSEELGQFAISQAAVVFGTAAARNTIGVSILTRDAAADGRASTATAMAAQALGWTILSAPLQAGAGVPTLALIAGALGAIGIGVLDSLRLNAIAHANPRRSAIINLTTLTAATTSLPLGHHWSFTTLIYYSALTACAVSLKLLGRASRGQYPNALKLRYTLRLTHSTGPLVSLYLSNALVPLLLPSLIALFGNLHDTATVRSAQTLTALGLQIPQGLQPMALAAAARDKRQSRFPIRQSIVAWLLAGAASVAGAGVVVLCIPSGIGRYILGTAWGPAHDTLPVFLAGSVLQLIITAIELDLKAKDKLANTPQARGVGAALSLILAITGEAMLGPTGVALGLIVANCWTMTSLMRIARHLSDKGAELHA